MGEINGFNNYEYFFDRVNAYFFVFLLYLIVKKAVYRGVLEALETLERKDNFIDTNEVWIVKKEKW